MKKSLRHSVLLLLLVSVLSTFAVGATTSFFTPTGSSVTDGPVNAQGTFVTSTGRLVITLQDLLVNPTSVGQLLSDLDFVVGGLTGSSLLSSSSAQEITVAKNGTATTGSTGS